jgi:competence protein ComEC
MMVVASVKLKQLAMFAAAACLGLFAPATRAMAAEGRAPGLQIVFVDVLGGAATLIVTPERESILIDSGWPGEGGRDPDRIVRALKAAGCDRIDHLVTTHWHMDHYGGIAGLVERVEIGRFWDRGLPEDGNGGDFPDGPREDDPLAIAYRKASKGKRTILKPGDKLPLRGDVSAVVLAASGETIAAPASTAHNPHCDSAPADQEPDRSDNAQSIVLKFRLGEFDFLDCGDLTWNVEKKLVCPVDLVGPVDLFQVTHHGMDISNHPTLLATAAPTVAVMNNGPRKGGSAETVHRFRDLPSVQAFYQLHRNAQTGDEDNGDPALIANADPAGGKNIRVTVAPGGETYTVRLGDRSGRGGLRPGRLGPRPLLAGDRLVLPASVEPEVLREVLADQLLQGARVALGEQAGVLDPAGELARLDDLGAPQLVAEAGTDTAGDPHHHRGLVLDRQQGDGLVGGGGPAEEIDEQPALAGVLVGQHGEGPARFQYLDDLVVPPRLGDHLLAGALPERLEVALQVGVVERPRHGPRREAEQAEEVAGDLPVAVMARQQDDRFAGDQPIEHRGVPGKLDVLPVVLQPDALRRVEDFHQHHAEVPIDAPDGLVALGFRHGVAEREP